MTTTTHICDLCKTSVSEEHLAHFNIRTERKGLKIATESYGGISIDVCKSCLENKGFAVEIQTDKIEQQTLTNEQKLKDIFIDWLSDLGVMFEE